MLIYSRTTQLCSQLQPVGEQDHQEFCAWSSYICCLTWSSKPHCQTILGAFISGLTLRLRASCVILLVSHSYHVTRPIFRLRSEYEDHIVSIICCCLCFSGSQMPPQKVNHEDHSWSPGSPSWPGCCRGRVAFWILGTSVSLPSLSLSIRCHHTRDTLAPAQDCKEMSSLTHISLFTDL